jgi:hypothetical protein
MLSIKRFLEIHPFYFIIIIKIIILVRLIGKIIIIIMELIQIRQSVSIPKRHGIQLNGMKWRS